MRIVLFVVTAQLLFTISPVGVNAAALDSVDAIIDPGAAPDIGPGYPRFNEGRAASSGSLYRPANDYSPGYDYPSPAMPYRSAASPDEFR
jgi:hypothetical protein